MGAAFHQLGRETRPHDQQADHRDGRCHTGESGAVRTDIDARDRDDGKCRHAGKVQRDDRADETGESFSVIRPACITAQEPHGRHPQAHRQHDGRDDIGWLPADDAVGAVSEHADIMHGGDGKPDRAAAGDAAADAPQRRGQHDADPHAGDRDQGGHDRQHRIEIDGHAGFVSQHGDEMRGPGGGPGGYGRQQRPMQPRQPFIGNGTPEQPHGHAAPGHAHHQREQRDPRIVFGNQAGDDTHRQLSRPVLHSSGRMPG